MAAARWHPAFPSHVLGLALIALAWAGAATAPEALAGTEFSGCRGPDGAEVRTVIDEKLDAVAEFQFSDDGKSVTIHVNPYGFDYGPETMLWLYHRQCALIEIMRDRPGSTPSLDDHAKADCIAAQSMQKANLLGRHELESIDRTINPKAMPDFEKQLGPWRRIDLYRCLDQGG